MTMTILPSESCSSTPTDSSDGDDDAILDFDHLQRGPSIIPPNPHPKSETSAFKLTPAMPQHFISLAGQQNIRPTSIDTKDRYEDTKFGDVLLKPTSSLSLAEDAYVPFVDPTKLTTRILLSETRGSSTPTGSPRSLLHLRLIFLHHSSVICFGLFCSRYTPFRPRKALLFFNTLISSSLTLIPSSISCPAKRLHLDYILADNAAVIFNTPTCVWYCSTSMVSSLLPV